jgi:RimJ/RimL family protein N-acetyltransferase
MNIETTLRLVTLADAELLLKWRNDNLTRKSSHSAGIVSSNDHNEWLKEIIVDKKRNLYIAEEYGKPVGTVRADYSSESWELSWSVSPESRNQGVAKRMVSKLASKITEPIRAEVKKDNIASAKVAEYVGMKLDIEKNGIRYYKRGESL